MLTILITAVLSVIFVCSILSVVFAFINSRDSIRNNVMLQQQGEQIKQLQESYEYENEDEEAFTFTTEDGRHNASSFEELMQMIASDPSYNSVTPHDMEEFRKMMENEEDGEGWKNDDEDEEEK